MNLDDMVAMLDELEVEALRVYKADKATGANAVSVAFNAGRVDAFKQVLDALISKGGKTRGQGGYV